ncbi:MAG: M23 family metallopeptidase [Bdellovibrionales bacterium]|nr:M23 family metallopeptidase [Bdellovibrionales bacterium]
MKILGKILLVWSSVLLFGCASLNGTFQSGRGASDSSGFVGPGDLKRPTFVGLDGKELKLNHKTFVQSGGQSVFDEEEPPSPFVAVQKPQKSKFIKYKPQRSFALSWPLNMVKVNQYFNPKKKRRPHLGVDLAGVKGTPIFSAHEGLVIYAGRAFKGFGKLVIIEYDDRWASLYAHMDKIMVKQGQTVESGQTLGLMGRTGRATGVHLHFELLHDQRPVDPIPLLNNTHQLVDSRTETDGHRAANL